MPPVEVVAGERTDPAVVERVSGTLSELGKLPIRRARRARLRSGTACSSRSCARRSGSSRRASPPPRRRHGDARGARAALAPRRPVRASPRSAASSVWQRVGANLLPELSARADLAALDRHVPADGLAEAAAARDEALAEELYRDRGRARSTIAPVVEPRLARPAPRTPAARPRPASRSSAMPVHHRRAEERCGEAGHAARARRVRRELLRPPPAEPPPSQSIVPATTP